MNRRMAARTIAARLKTQPAVRNIHRERIDMALQALESLFSPRQQHLIHTSVRIVAGQASLHFHRRVLKYERPPLLDVALDARFPTRLPHVRAVGGSVRIVAIGALHRSFQHLVVKGLAKLRLGFRVAAPCLAANANYFRRKLLIGILRRCSWRLYKNPLFHHLPNTNTLSVRVVWPFNALRK